jgi:hypothetical protein
VRAVAVVAAGVARPHVVELHHHVVVWRQTADEVLHGLAERAGALGRVALGLGEGAEGTRRRALAGANQGLVLDKLGDDRDDGVEQADHAERDGVELLLGGAAGVADAQGHAVGVAVDDDRCGDAGLNRSDGHSRGVDRVQLRDERERQHHEPGSVEAVHDGLGEHRAGRPRLDNLEAEAVGAGGTRLATGVALHSQHC